MALKYKRILLKLSGEVLKGASDACHDEAILADVAKRLAELVALGAEVGVVIGGGNIFRGLTGARNGTDRVLGGRDDDGAAHAPGGAHLRRARGYPPDGPGHRGPLRRRHRQPLLLHRLRRGPPRGGNRRPYQEALAKDLHVMDAAAFALCRDNNIPIVVFDFHAPDSLRRVVCGEPGLGTVVS